MRRVRIRARAVLNNGAQPVEQVRTLRWKRGIELPPFVSSNDDALALCAAIASGTVELLPDVIVSDAVALQIVRLVMSGSAVGGGWNSVYVILATLKAGRLIPVNHARVATLRQMLTRKRSAAGAGLQHTFQQLVKFRARSTDMRSMTLEEATEHVLKKWDLIELTFDFGGGGGDPGSGDPGSGVVQGSSAARPKALDVRTKALSAALAEWGGGMLIMKQHFLSGGSSTQRGISTFVEASGDLGDDPLWMIDDSVRGTPPRHQAKRTQTFEAQLVEQRKQTDALRQQVTELEAMRKRLEVEPERQRRHLKLVLADARKWREDSRRDLADALQRGEEDRREERRQASAKLLALKKEWQAERVAADLHVTRLQADITDLERKLLRAAGSSRTAGKAAARTEAAMAAELELALQGRTWARVNDEACLPLPSTSPHHPISASHHPIPTLSPMKLRR